MNQETKGLKFLAAEVMKYVRTCAAKSMHQLSGKTAEATPPHSDQEQVIRAAVAAVRNLKLSRIPRSTNSLDNARETSVQSPYASSGDFVLDTEMSAESYDLPRGIQSAMQIGLCPLVVRKNGDIKG